MSPIDWSSLALDAAKVLAGILLLPVKNLAVAIWNRLLHDLPYVHGKYHGKYHFRLKGAVEEVEAEETIRVRKIGRWIWATAEMTRPLTKKWKIRGEIRGHCLFATVESATRATLSGKGFILLHSIENGSELEGHMMWVDSKLKAIYTTPYSWKRLDKEEQE